MVTHSGSLSHYLAADLTSRCDSRALAQRVNNHVNAPRCVVARAGADRPDLRIRSRNAPRANVARQDRWFLLRECELPRGAGTAVFLPRNALTSQVSKNPMATQPNQTPSLTPAPTPIWWPALTARSWIARSCRAGTGCTQAPRKSKEERLRWQYYGSIPQKHWRQMSGAADEGHQRAGRAVRHPLRRRDHRPAGGGAGAAQLPGRERLQAGPRGRRAPARRNGQPGPRKVSGRAGGLGPSRPAGARRPAVAAR